LKSNKHNPPLKALSEQIAMKLITFFASIAALLFSAVQVSGATATLPEIVCQRYLMVHIHCSVLSFASLMET
jgi:hypothetical protein